MILGYENALIWTLFYKISFNLILVMLKVATGLTHQSEAIRAWRVVSLLLSPQKQLPENIACALYDN